MSTNPEQLNDLLNGLLDGILTDEEQRSLDLAMKADPSLEARLTEMQALRRSLLRGRSVGRLGSDFSKHVVDSARKRAEAMGDEAPEWLVRSTRPTADRSAKQSVEPRGSRVNASMSSDLPTKTPTVSQRAWKVWIPMLAMASIASLVLYLAGPLSSPIPEQRLVDRTGLGPADGSARNERDAGNAATELLADGDVSPQPSDLPMPSSESELVPESEPESQVAATSPIPDASSETIPSATNLPSLPMTDRSVVSNGTVSEKSTNPIQEMLDAKGIKNPVYTLVADVSVDPIAGENDAMRRLLEEHEILYTEDLNISAEQLDSLVATQLVGMMAGVDVPHPSGDVQVFFVRAKARRIDSFLRAVASQYRDFPQYRLDMSVDPAVLQLSTQLGSVVSNDDGARRLTFRSKDDLGLVSSFPAGIRKGEPLAIAKREQLGNQPKPPKLSSRDETSYLILLVRSSSSEGAPR
ncbi:MAG: hypothetical protein ACK6DC_05090 [Planctomycetota bacterium]